MAGTALSLASQAARPKPKVPLVRIGTRFFREIVVGKGEEKQVVLVPVDVEFNLDPLEVVKAVGILGAVLVGGGLLAYVAWEGLTLGTPLGAFRVIRGMKETPFWQGQATRAQTLLKQRQIGEGFITDKTLNATDSDDIACPQARVLYSGLSDFSRGFCRRNGLSREECVAEWRKLKERCDL